MVDGNAHRLACLQLHYSVLRFSRRFFGRFRNFKTSSRIHTRTGVVLLGTGRHLRWVEPILRTSRTRHINAFDFDRIVPVVYTFYSHLPTDSYARVQYIGVFPVYMIILTYFSPHRHTFALIGGGYFCRRRRRRSISCPDAESHLSAAH